MNHFLESENDLPFPTMDSKMSVILDRCGLRLGGQDRLRFENLLQWMTNRRDWAYRVSCRIYRGKRRPQNYNDILVAVVRYIIRQSPVKEPSYIDLLNVIMTDPILINILV